MTAMNHISRADLCVFKQLVANTNAADEFQRIAGKTSRYPGKGTALGIAYVALKMNGEAGELAEHVGKAMRDDGYIIEEVSSEWNEELVDEPIFLSGEFTPERRLLIIKEIGDVLWYCQAAAGELGVTLSEVMLGNLEKIIGRNERGTLSGSGDNR